MKNKVKQVVLITGTSQGIGLETAKYLLSKGYIVYGSSRKIASNHEFPTLQLDVTNDESVKSCVDELMGKEGKIDILVNNAGIVLVGAIEESSIEDIYKQFETNFFGIHRMVTAVLPIIKKQQSGRIINVGSFGGRLSLPFQTFYSASKAALAMYTDGLRMELYSSGIKVSLIEPGDTKTDVDKGIISSRDYDPNKNLIAKQALDIMREAEEKGRSSIGVAKAIHKAIKSKRPKPRYTTGFDAKFFGLLQRFLPFTLQERLIMMTYKVPRKRK